MTSRWLFERGGLLALATLALYVWVAPAHLVYGDNAEFAALGAVGGVAHPTGYPLYVLWLRAWSWLPGANPVHVAAIATAILGALAVLVLHAACRAWGARPRTATLVCGLFAVGPLALRIHTQAEVFALNGVVVATIVWLAGTGGPLRGLWRVVALGLVAGLGLANHHTCVLVAPIGLLGAVRGVREAACPRWLAVGAGGLALLVGLTPYLYLLIAPDSFPSWGPVHGLGGIVDHFLRNAYGGPFSLSASTQSAGVLDNELALALSLGRTFWYVPAALGLAAFGVGAARGTQHESRWAWGLLAASWLLAGPILIGRFNLLPHHLDFYVVQRFHLLPSLLLAVPIAIAIDRASEYVKVSDRGQRLASVAIAVSLVAAAGLSLRTLVHPHSREVDRGLRNLLATLPPDAIVIAATDEAHFGTRYLQGVLGMRRDVSIITTLMVPLPGYRERVTRETGIVLDTSTPQRMSVVIAEQALATKRPVFIDPIQANIASSFPVYPYGLLFRVLPPGTPLPPIEEAFAINKDLFERYQLDYESPSRDVPTMFHHQYARTWFILARALERAGRHEDKAFALALAQALAPP